MHRLCQLSGNTLEFVLNDCVVLHKVDVSSVEKVVILANIGVDIRSNLARVSHVAVVKFFVVGLELLNVDMGTNGSTPFRTEWLSGN